MAVADYDGMALPAAAQALVAAAMSYPVDWIGRARAARLEVVAAMAGVAASDAMRGATTRAFRVLGPPPDWQVAGRLAQAATRAMADATVRRLQRSDAWSARLAVLVAFLIELTAAAFLYRGAMLLAAQRASCLAPDR